MTFIYRERIPPEAMDQAHAMVSDWDVVRMLGTWPWPSDRAYTEKRLTEKVDGLTVAVFDSDTLLGSGGLVEGRWGLMVARPHWRRGVGRAIAEFLFPRGFALGLDAVSAEVWADNQPSHRLHKVLGFVETGRNRKMQPARGHEVENVDYVLTRDAWEARP